MKAVRMAIWVLTGFSFIGQIVLLAAEAPTSWMTRALLIIWIFNFMVTRAQVDL